MRSYESLSHLQNAGLPGPVHLAIGMFDGVHLGHQAIIAGAVRSAAAVNGTAAVLTFAPHPGRVLHPEAPVQLIYDNATKTSLIASLGVAVHITEPFTPALAALGAAEFITLLRRTIPNLAGIHVGDNFRFGHGRTADATALEAPGLRVFITPCVEDATGRVSSSRIRELLAQGDPAAAAALLGHAYTSTGRITSGRALGRQLGFPTLNLEWQPELTPRYGVYVVRACLGADTGGAGTLSLKSAVGGSGFPQDAEETGPSGNPDAHLAMHGADCTTPGRPNTCEIRLGSTALFRLSATPGSSAFDSPRWCYGVANYGLRPTVEAANVAPRLETHLFADAGTVAAAGLDAGSPVRVEWLHFLRPEKKFARLDVLLAQIRADTATAREWLRQRQNKFKN